MSIESTKNEQRDSVAVQRFVRRGGWVNTGSHWNRGKDAHKRWEQRRRHENECDAEQRIRRIAATLRIAIPPQWWDGWFSRSDAWRDEIGHDSPNVPDQATASKKIPK